MYNLLVEILFEISILILQTFFCTLIWVLIMGDKGNRYRLPLLGQYWITNNKTFSTQITISTFWLGVHLCSAILSFESVDGLVGIYIELNDSQII